MLKLAIHAVIIIVIFYVGDVMLNDGRLAASLQQWVSLQLMRLG